MLFYNYSRTSSYSFGSSVCDFGTGNSDNGSDDVYFYDRYAGTGAGTYSYGDDETFSCTASAGGCQ